MASFLLCNICASTLCWHGTILALKKQIDFIVLASFLHYFFTTILIYINVNCLYKYYLVMSIILIGYYNNINCGTVLAWVDRHTILSI